MIAKEATINNYSQQKKICVQAAERTMLCISIKLLRESLIYLTSVPFSSLWSLLVLDKIFMNCMP